MSSELALRNKEWDLPYGAQTTLKSTVTFEGVGTHGGEPVTMTLHPTSAGGGIVFVRTDVEHENNVIPALWNSVSDTMMCTKISNSAGVSVATIEHIMAALYACEIDNVRIEINGPEVPIMDGSSQEFVATLLKAGTISFDYPRQVIAIKRPIIVRDQADRWVSIAPKDHLHIECEFGFKGRANFETQNFTGDMTPEIFINDIAQARTFGFVEDVLKLRSMGLAKGSSLENAIGIQDDQILNPEGLRYKDEFVRHKVLDVVGDLYTAGYRIHGHFRGSNTGHGLLNQLLRALFSDEKNWEIQS